MYIAGFVIPVEASGEIPFDPKRLILGCFKPIYAMGRSYPRS
jgi:uncharacterized protein YbaA (DUF1428 family)